MANPDAIHRTAMPELALTRRWAAAGVKAYTSLNVHDAAASAKNQGLGLDKAR